MKDRYHVMVDVETYGLASNSVFRSIGAVLFSLDWEESNMVILIDCGVSIEEQLMYGSVIDQSTVNFWRDQPKEVQNKLLGKQQRSLQEVLLSLRDNVEKTANGEKVYLWSHGSNFDTVILDSAYKALGIRPFWTYKYVRDTRTLFDLVEYEYEAKGGHDALEDAKKQAVAVREAYQQYLT